MRRAELEHTIRAAIEIIAQDSVIIIGSQAILGSYTDDELPTQTTQSIEVDMVPLTDDDAATLATQLDGALGEWSPFHQTHGYYVQGVGRDTAVLPHGWEQRLEPPRGELERFARSSVLAHRALREGPCRHLLLRVRE